MKYCSCPFNFFIKTQRYPIMTTIMAWFENKIIFFGFSNPLWWIVRSLRSYVCGEVKCIIALSYAWYSHLIILNIYIGIDVKDVRNEDQLTFILMGPVPSPLPIKKWLFVIILYTQHERICAFNSCIIPGFNV